MSKYCCGANQRCRLSKFPDLQCARVWSHLASCACGGVKTGWDGTRLSRAKKHVRPERQLPGVDASGNSRVKQSPWEIANAGEEAPEAGPRRRSTSEISLATAGRTRCSSTGFVAGVSRSRGIAATLHRPVRQLRRRARPGQATARTFSSMIRFSAACGSKGLENRSPCA